jgi:glycosyltransferase involved in cell wall biosynthesis
LNFLQWLKSEGDVQFEVALLQDGPLLADYRAVARTEVIAPSMTIGSRIARRLRGHRGWEERENVAWARHAARRFDVAYVNTIVPKRQIVALAQAGLPVVCHVHELEFAVHFWLGREGLAPVIPSVSRFIAVSSAVRDFLVTRSGIPDSRVSLVHEFVPLSTPSGNAESRQSIRAKLGLRDDDVLVGACGTIDWRKGADLFLLIAQRVVRAEPRVRFVWLGAEPGTSSRRRFLHDIERADLGDVVHVLDSTPDPGSVFSAMDVFALTSREDPFPLAMLEAAARGLPIACFARSGGGPEFVGSDAGLIAAYMDVDGFADNVLSLVRDRQARERLGGNGERLVRERYSLELQAPRLKALIAEAAAPTARVPLNPRIAG